MEAGGFEPPSRDVSRQASTCVVARLRFRVTERRTTGSRIGYSGASRLRRPGRPTKTSPLIGALAGPAGRNPTGRAALFTQPWHTGSCHLGLRYRMINQANRCPGHAAYPSTIRSKPFAPVFTCQKEPRPKRTIASIRRVSQYTLS